MSKKLKCRIGDLAVIVDAFNKGNVGKIVRVVDQYSYEKSTWLTGLNDHFDWIVTCPTPLVWATVDEGRLRRKRGPVPDFALQPIKGISAEDQHATERPKTKKRAKVQCGKNPQQDKQTVPAQVVDEEQPSACR